MSLPFVPEIYLNWNLGIILSGIGITGAIFGLACAQTGFYLRHYWAQDRALLRSIVSIVWTADCLHLGLYSYTIYYYLVFKHNDFFGQLQLPWTTLAQMIVNTTLVATVQFFYVLRVWSLCKHLAVIGFLILIVVANWAVGVLLMIKSKMATSVAALIELKDYNTATSSLLAFTDIAITTTLVVLLVTSRTSGSRSKRLISRLVFYTINTGLMTSICAFLSLITNLMKGDTNLYVLFSYLGASLYTVSMIASLNAREGLRNHMAEAPGITTIPQLTRGGESTLQMMTSRHAVRIPPEIFVETSVETRAH
ncbi:hypothetical protein C8Q76DRAFT_717133 [Earliella scabrosa]|nr:hypothetical protein C8Q76DRAFT_717133 [Earliella scabrosa]